MNELWLARDADGMTCVFLREPILVDGQFGAHGVAKFIIGFLGDILPKGIPVLCTGTKRRVRLELEDE